MNKELSINKDTIKIKNKIQAIYALTLIIFASLVIVASLASINITSAAVLSELNKAIIFLIVMGSLLSVPIYVLEKRIEEATMRQIKLSNYILNVYFVVLFLFLAYMLYSLIYLAL